MTTITSGFRDIESGENLSIAAPTGACRDCVKISSLVASCCLGILAVVGVVFIVAPLMYCEVNTEIDLFQMDQDSERVASSKNCVLIVTGLFAEIHQ